MSGDADRQEYGEDNTAQNNTQPAAGDNTTASSDKSHRRFLMDWQHFVDWCERHGKDHNADDAARDYAEAKSNHIHWLFMKPGFMKKRSLHEADKARRKENETQERRGGY
ncbi:MAG: hypothetical protein Q9162_007625 [Coniocarpon cinnabarinum]